MIRRAKHAGTWYSDDPMHLYDLLENNLNKVNVFHQPARALIVPHAGYQYSGRTAAFSYKQIDPERVKRIFILGPSHHIRINGCALSSARMCATPFYDLLVDEKINIELENAGFSYMNLKDDENEHSIELQLPYIAHVMERQRGRFTIVPILVGSIAPDREREFGKILAPYMADPDNLFVISSDFCHWGSCFRYKYYDKSYGAIYESIEHIDRLALDIIENLNPTEFINYFKKFNNTICGRHPISIFLQIVQECLQTNRLSNLRLKFLNYKQSNKCMNQTDSSVSYAAGSLVLE